MKSERNNFLIHTNFLTAKVIGLFYYCEKMFIFMNMWMIGKNSKKHQGLYSNSNMENNTDVDYTHAKVFVKILK